MNFFSLFFFNPNDQGLILLLERLSTILLGLILLNLKLFRTQIVELKKIFQ